MSCEECDGEFAGEKGCFRHESPVDGPPVLKDSTQLERAMDIRPPMRSDEFIGEETLLGSALVDGRGSELP